MLEIGAKVQNFTLKDSTGKDVSLYDYLGKRIVLYFYPKDDTPGCTKQACSFRDKITDFKDLDVVVIGVSKDDIESHRKFTSKYDLPFVLLSDPTTEVMQYFGSWGRKVLYGKESIGAIRSSFIINKDGVIEKVYKKASALTNADSILKYLKEVK